MAQQIILYDIARRGVKNTCWSFNVWKTRLVLNYKELPYSTRWVTHETLAPTISALGLPPNTAPGPPYTVPTITDANGTATTDSAVIAKLLEGQHPQKPLHFDDQLEAEANKVAFMAASPLFPMHMPYLAREVVLEPSVRMFVAAREKRFGMNFAEWEKMKGGETAWNTAAPGFDALRHLLIDNKIDDGPFILGSQVSYADFIITAVLEAYNQTHTGMFQRILNMDERFERHYQASKQWVRKDD